MDRSQVAELVNAQVDYLVSWQSRLNRSEKLHTGSNPVLTTKKIKVMKKFEDLEFKILDDAPHMFGKQAKLQFDNGFGVSVVSHTFSYGGKDGLFEVAVLDKDGKLTYETFVANVS